MSKRTQFANSHRFRPEHPRLSSVPREVPGYQGKPDTSYFNYLQRLFGFMAMVRENWLWSKKQHRPKQGAREMARRRRQMRTGEFAPC